MSDNLIQIKNIEKNQKFLGAKTLNLKKCLDWGYNIPKFIAIGSNSSQKILTDEIYRKSIVQEAISILQSKKYAVRSSALIEDSSKESLAGQFLTKINITETELDQAIYDVLKQAKGLLNNNLDKFSLLIQEYINPDIFRVTFTRNPNGGREMMIEYGFCEGDQIVGGKIKPDKISFYWNEKALLNKYSPNLSFPQKWESRNRQISGSPIWSGMTQRAVYSTPNENIKSSLSKPFYTKKIIEKFKDLERKSNFPQDIEWCIQNNRFYLLQTRPITTLSEIQYNQIKYLDKELPKKRYFFEKTEIFEIASRPSIMTLDLLKLIYSNTGPVSKVYKKYQVDYQDTNFLKIIGNELFVDKEKEIQGLLPSYSYLSTNNFLPKFYRYLKLLPTVKNLFYLNKIRTKNYDQLFGKIKIKIETKSYNNQDLNQILENFFIDYELIFEINLLSGLSIKKLDLWLKNQPINFPEIINGTSYFIDLKNYQVRVPKNLKGNSLELTDESDFIAYLNHSKNNQERVKNWWQKISGYQKSIIQKLIIEAIIYNRLRELGRWLMLKNLNSFKNLLLDLASEKRFKNAKDIFFSYLDDVLSNQLSELKCLDKKKVYKKFNHYSLPSSLTSSLITKKSIIFGVSSGLAKGHLINLEMIKKEKSSQKVILYVECLSPNITKYFKRITGIISNNGGFLSHLAIIAREKHIPIVVGFSLEDSNIQLGDQVEINGSTGEILKND